MQFIEIAFVAGVCAIAGAFYWGFSTLFRPATRNRMIREYGLPGDDTTLGAVERFVRTVSRGEAAGFALGLAASWSVPAGAPATQHGYRLPTFSGFVMLYAGILLGAAVACAFALRQSASTTRRRASLVPRDAIDYLPRGFAAAGFACAGFTFAAGVFALLFHEFDAAVRATVIGVLAITAFVSVVLLPLVNRLARLPMRIDSDADEALGAAIREASVRLVAGNAVAVVFFGAGVAVAAAMQASGWTLVVPFVFWLLGVLSATSMRPSTTWGLMPRPVVQYFARRQRATA